jgi:regulatory protein
VKITSLKAHPRRKGRVRVYLDGQYAFELTEIQAARLHLGQELDEAAVARLREVDTVEQAYERALKLISSRPHSEAELKRKLRERKIDLPVIEAALERLRRAGLVNDQAFAAYWVENRGTFRPRSKRVLKAELKRKGVVDDGVLGEALSAANDAEAAYNLASRRARVPRMRALPYKDFRRRLGEFLARRGFDYDLVDTVVERVWKEVMDDRRQMTDE